MDHSQVSATEQPAAQADNKATRHLCTGVYLDPDFRDRAIRKVHNDPSHRVAPSYGFDLVPVVEHAWRAWRLETAQHVWVLSVFIIGFTANEPAAITAASVIGLWHLVRHMLRTAPRVLSLRTKTSIDRWMHRHNLRDGDDRLREQTRLLGVSAGGCILLIALPMMIAGSRHAPLREVTASAALLLLLMAGVAAAVGAIRQCALNAMYKAGSLRPATLTRRQIVIDDQQSHCCAVYRRPGPKDRTDEALVFPSPYRELPFFVGSGRLIHRSAPLVIQLLREGRGSMAELEYITAPFQAHELVDELRRNMAPVGDTADPICLPGLQVGERVYVAETDVATERECLQATSARERLKSIVNDPHGITDHFLEVSVATSGELVTTVFLRVTIKGRSLSLDFAACALTRTPANYHVLDAFAESGKGAILRSAFRGVRDLPAGIGRLWRLGEAPLLLARAVWARKDRTLTPRRGVTIGTRLSIREEKSVPWSEAEFDEPTIADQVMIIELRLLRAAEDFLKSKGISTSVFHKRAETIISTGVLNMGGRLNINNVAVGKKAQINHGAAAGNRADNGAHTEGAKP